DGVEIDSMPVIWAPGQGTVEYPEGVGAPLRAGDLVVIQVHYNLAAQHMVGASDSTAVRLRLADAVELEGVYLAIDPFLDTLFEETPDVLPAGMASAPYTWEVPIGAW